MTNNNSDTYTQDTVTEGANHYLSYGMDMLIIALGFLASIGILSIVGSLYPR